MWSNRFCKFGVAVSVPFIVLQCDLLWQSIASSVVEDCHYSRATAPDVMLLDNDKRRTDYNLKNAFEKIKARNGYLSTTNTDNSQWRHKTGGTPAFHTIPEVATSGSVMSLLSPVYTCPWTLHRTNYVSESNFDGGKWTCGLEEIYAARRQQQRSSQEAPKCVVYSFGSNNDDFFERDVQRLDPDCEIHIFDPTSGVPPASWKDKYQFHPLGLCVGDTTTSFTVGEGNQKKTFPCKSLQAHMKDLGHSHVDIFKADVEGMEWDLVSNWQNETRIGQVLLEFHFWVKSPSLPELLREYIIPLERLGYFLQTLEPVAAKIPAFEITFLNVNWCPQGVHRGIFNSQMYPSTPGVNND